MSEPRPISRRGFLHATAAVAGGAAAASLVGCQGAGGTRRASAREPVRIQVDPEDPIVRAGPVQWAIAHLCEELAAWGIDARVEEFRIPGAGRRVLLIAGAKSAVSRVALGRILGRNPDATARMSAENDRFAETPESVALIPLDPGADLLATAPDALGLVYALTELTDRMRFARDPYAAFTQPSRTVESPASPYRGIVRLFASEIEDKRWFYDRASWEQYLDMLVTQRFNHFNLSFGLSYDMSTNLTDTYTFFLYPFMLDVPGYKVRALASNGTALPAEEQKKNLDTLKFISDQAALRGLKFTLGIWTHSFRWTNSPNATYTIDGLDAQSMPLYSRDALKALIDACPNITGINLRTHGESGVPEGNYDFWKVIMSGLTGHKHADGTNRILELDLHAKSLTPALIDIAQATGMPVILSCKLWAEHMGLPYMQASIREAEMPKERDEGGLMGMSNGTRSLLRYGVGDLLTTGRTYKMIHRVWPGSQKVLLWGDPELAAEYGRTGAFAGMDGIDFFEPLSFRGRAGSSLGIPRAPDRSGYADGSLRTQYDWEKYAYTYRLWGRLSYNPAAAAETWQRVLKSDYGTQATQIEIALANASRILPLITTAHDPAAAGDQYWPEMYTNQSLYDAATCPYSEAPAPKVFGNISSLDPQLFATVNQYVDALLTHKPDGKVTPLDVAQILGDWSTAAISALSSLENIDTDPRPEKIALRRAKIDVEIAAGIGYFFAHKFRAAILWQLFNLSAHEPARAAALDAYKKARAAWAALAGAGKVYLPNLTFGINANLHGHWSDRLAAIDADIAGLAAAAPAVRDTNYPPAAIQAAIALVQGPAQPNPLATQVLHAPPATFKPGDSPLITLLLAPGASFDGIRLWYRHLHQGQRWQVLDMKYGVHTYGIAIPAEYTTAPFPLQYYFEIRAAGLTALYPGFRPGYIGTPYFVLLPAG